MNSFYTPQELEKIGFKKYGSDVMVSRKCSIYSADKIELGDHVRIDDFVILSGRMKLGNYIHISAYTGLFGGEAGIELNDFATISSRVMIYAVNDDYSGETMTNPMIPAQYRGVVEKKVVIEKYVIIGSGSLVLPGVRLGEGAALGAMSMAKDDLVEWKMYAGIPCRYIKDRKRDLQTFERELHQSVAHYENVDLGEKTNEIEENSGE